MKYMERKKNNDDDDKNNNDNDNNDADKSKSSIKISKKRMSILDIPDGNVVSSNYGDLYSSYPLTSSSSSSSSSSRINGKNNESLPKSSSTLNLESNTAVRNNGIIRTSQRNVDMYNFLKLIVCDESGGVNNIQQREGRL